MLRNNGYISDLGIRRLKGCFNDVGQKADLQNRTRNTLYRVSGNVQARVSCRAVYHLKTVVHGERGVGSVYFRGFHKKLR